MKLEELVTACNGRTRFTILNRIGDELTLDSNLAKNMVMEREVCSITVNAKNELIVKLM